MPIIGTLPNNIQNGSTVDATPVMADFNFIVNQVNANANPTGTFTAPSGTAMPFQQAAAPAGWVAQTGAAYSDSVLHVVTPSTFVGLSGAGSAVGFLQNPWGTGGTALTIAQMPAHNHTDSGHSHGITDPSHSHVVPMDIPTSTGSANDIAANNGISTTHTITTQNSTTGITVNTGTANIQNNGGGAAHTHQSAFNLQFVDHIVAVKT